MSRICDVNRGRDHVVRFTRPSGSVFAYWKRSKTGAGEGLGTRLSVLAPSGCGVRKAPRRGYNVTSEKER